MATAQHPTTEQGAADTVDDVDGTRRDAEEPTVGIDHVTVVPTNLEASD